VQSYDFILKLQRFIAKNVLIMEVFAVFWEKFWWSGEFAVSLQN
jgi:hypothetical protein